jgi:hypothetical protein
MSTQTNRYAVHRVLEEFWQSYGDNPGVVDELFATHSTVSAQVGPSQSASDRGSGPSCDVRNRSPHFSKAVATLNQQSVEKNRARMKAVGKQLLKGNVGEGKQYACLVLI